MNRVLELSLRFLKSLRARRRKTNNKATFMNKSNMLQHSCQNNQSRTWINWRKERKRRSSIMRKKLVNINEPINLSVSIIS